MASMGRALVTGCSKGVGFATALAFAVDGWDMTATMRDPTAHGGALRVAASAAGVELSIAPLDVTDDRSVAAAIAAAGPFDVLVNNAAVTQFCSVEETPIEDWQLMLETNFLGPVRCMRAVLPTMRAQGHGCIVNVSTIAARAAFPGTGAYASSKAALEHASAVAAIEARPHGIRVVVVEAGSMATGMQPTGTSLGPDSPYRSTIRNTMHYLGANRPAATDPHRIAAAIVDLANRTDTPLRVPAGQAAAETLALRNELGDDGWHEFIADPEFARRYEPPPAGS
jgi:NAD(P)-dependent dehydrogenase (short-subunit alcohol dehydrogenase family)